MPKQATIKKNKRNTPTQQDTHRFYQGLDVVARPVGYDTRVRPQAQQPYNTEALVAGLRDFNKGMWGIGEEWMEKEQEKGALMSQRGEELPKDASEYAERGYQFYEGRKQSIEFQAEVQSYHEKNWMKPMDEYDKGLTELYAKRANGKHDFWMKGFGEKAQNVIGTAKTNQRSQQANLTRKEQLNNQASHVTDLLTQGVPLEVLMTELDAMKTQNELIGIHKSQSTQSFVNAVIEYARETDNIDMLKQLKAKPLDNGVKVGDARNLDGVAMGEVIDAAIDKIEDENWERDQRDYTLKLREDREYSSAMIEQVSQASQKNDLKQLDTLEDEIKKNFDRVDPQTREVLYAKIEAARLGLSEFDNNMEVYNDFRLRSYNSDTSDDPTIEELQAAFLRRDINAKTMDMFRKENAADSKLSKLRSQPGYKLAEQMIDVALPDPTIKDPTSGMSVPTAQGDMPVKQLALMELYESVLTDPPKTTAEFKQRAADVVDGWDDYVKSREPKYDDGSTMEDPYDILQWQTQNENLTDAEVLFRYQSFNSDYTMTLDDVKKFYADRAKAAADAQKKAEAKPEATAAKPDAPKQGDSGPSWWRPEEKDYGHGFKTITDFGGRNIDDPANLLREIKGVLDKVFAGGSYDDEEDPAMSD
jgi:hypothetical protein